MIEPKRVLRALAEHWALLEPLCEHFDQGTLSLDELRAQLAAQQLDSTPQDITSLLDVWIRLDILVPVAKSPNRFELNAQIHDFLAYLAQEHRLGLCLEIEAYLRHLERLAGYIQDAFDIRDGHDLARQLRLLDMRVRDVLKKLANDEQALVAVAERAKTSDRQIPLRQRYAEVSGDLGRIRRADDPAGERRRRLRARRAQGRKRAAAHADRAATPRPPGRRRHAAAHPRAHPRNADQRPADPAPRPRTAVAVARRSTPAQRRDPWRRAGPVGDPPQRASTPCRKQRCRCSPGRKAPSSAVPARSKPTCMPWRVFEPKPARFPKAHKTHKGEAPRAPRTVKEMLERCEDALPMPDLMTWLLEQEPDGATDELLYWFSRLSREKRFKRERLERRDYHTHEHQVSLRSFALLSAAPDATENSASTPYAS